MYELRDNLITKIKLKENVFKGIIGYEDTVIPEIERAILSRHNMNLLGLRGQAKTRIARQMIELLDEYTPIVAGSELNDDPLKPISNFAKDKIAAGIDVVSFLAATTIFPSKGEARKTVQGGGVSINRKKVEGIDLKVDSSLLLHDKYLLVQKGKKNYYLICLL